MAHDSIESQALILAAKYDYDADRLWAIYWDELLPRVDELRWEPVDIAKRAWEISRDRVATMGQFEVVAQRRDARAIPAR
jgi:hypothetical protein